MPESQVKLSYLATYCRHYAWKAQPFQEEASTFIQKKESGLLYSPTGSGKTVAVFPAALEHLTGVAQCEILWITPLRALVKDTEKALIDMAEALELSIKVAARTSDTSSAERARQKKKLPHVLITTPESLSLLLSYGESLTALSHVKVLIVDEWHEFLGSKRGTMLELCMARLRHQNQSLITWGLSATIGNVEQAAEVLLPHLPAEKRRLVSSKISRDVHIDTLLPATCDEMPWSGHIGLTLLPALEEKLRDYQSVLCFTNTRSQAEIWYKEFLVKFPTYMEVCALHHGSLDLSVRQAAEEGLKDGSIKIVFCTSSLDLGVDFSSVDHVFQLGSPKGIARLVQRAGRSNHRPGEASRLTFIPSHAIEVLEIAAARAAIEEHYMEPRRPILKPLDVLIQHLLTCAAGKDLDEKDYFSEVTSAYSYRSLSNIDFSFCLDFARQGGKLLEAYPQYRRLEKKDNLWSFTNSKFLRQHRYSIGTITSDLDLPVYFRSGGRLGTIEESFISRLSKKDSFLFAGRNLKLHSIRDGKVYVQKGSGKPTVSRWMGSRMPLSVKLASQLQLLLAGQSPGKETSWAAPLLEKQAKVSCLPGNGIFLIEQSKSREGYHSFFFPLAGRLVHEGLAALVAYRFGLTEPNTFSTAANDYGFEVLSKKKIEISDNMSSIFSANHLFEDLCEAINSSQMSKKQFREIARVTGLIHTGTPWQRKTGRQQEVSSSLLYDVFQRYDPENALLQQALREVLDREIEYERLVDFIESKPYERCVVKETDRFSPFAFPLFAERLRSRMSNEDFLERIASMKVVRA